MAISLFLDVDQVLTKYPIQMQYATMLGVSDQLRGVEQAFRERKASNDEFNDILIPLFRHAGFTRQFAQENFNRVRLQPWAENLLSLRVPRYLISSGPNYYIHAMAEKWGIDQERVICSEYTFDEEELIKECIQPISLHGKAEFVRERVAHYDITIGVGNDIAQDSPFLNLCTIPIVTKATDDFLSTRRLESVSLLVRNLAEVFPSVEKELPDLFIGSSREAISIAEAVQLGLQHDCTPVIWNQGVFSPGEGTLESLLQALPQFDFAVMVFSPDDQTMTRGALKPAVRDNVIFEFGLFMARLGPKRTFFMYPRDQRPDILSDLAGVTPIEYSHGPNLQAAVGPACTLLKRAISKLGALPAR